MEVELQTLNQPVITGNYKHYYVIDNELHIVMMNGQILVLTRQITEPERLLEDTLSAY